MVEREKIIKINVVKNIAVWLYKSLTCVHSDIIE